MNARPWSDLRPWRIGLAMTFCPVVPAALFTAALPLARVLGVTLSDDPRAYLAALAFTLAVAVLWFGLAGNAYLFIVARKRGRLGRLGCILLGAALATLLPVAIILVGIVVAPGEYAQPVTPAIKLQMVREDVVTTAELSCGAVPFGLLAGWILWRTGIRPARPNLANAAVFD
jgi:hypothetical protein